MPYSTNGFWDHPHRQDAHRATFPNCSPAGANYQIYDPLSTTPASGGRFQRNPLPGNLIPANKIDPIAAKLIQYYPKANASPTVDMRNNYTGSPNSYVDLPQPFLPLGSDPGPEPPHVRVL